LGSPQATQNYPRDPCGENHPGSAIAARLINPARFDKAKPPAARRYRQPTAALTCKPRTARRIGTKHPEIRCKKGPAQPPGLWCRNRL
jgi:hypothetical protein